MGAAAAEQRGGVGALGGAGGDLDRAAAARAPGGDRRGPDRLSRSVGQSRGGRLSPSRAPWCGPCSSPAGRSRRAPCRVSASPCCWAWRWRRRCWFRSCGICPRRSGSTSSPTRGVPLETLDWSPRTWFLPARCAAADGAARLAGVRPPLQRSVPGHAQLGRSERRLRRSGGVGGLCARARRARAASSGAVPAHLRARAGGGRRLRSVARGAGGAARRGVGGDRPLAAVGGARARAWRARWGGACSLAAVVLATRVAGRVCWRCCRSPRSRSAPIHDRARSRCGSRSWPWRCGRDRRRGRARRRGDGSRRSESCWSPILLVDLGPWALLHLPRGDTAAFYPVTSAIEKLRREAAAPGGPWRSAGEDLAVYPSLLSVYGLDEVRPHNPLAPRDYARVLYTAFGFSPARRYFSPLGNLGHPLLDFLNVRAPGVVLDPPGGARLPSGAADARSHRCRGARHLSSAAQRRRAAADLPADRSGRHPRRSDRRLGGAHARSAPGGAVRERGR